jgi:simple sugar transport system permease protein
LHSTGYYGDGAATLMAATPLTLGAMCGILCERSGIINIAIEGMMLTGAFTAIAFASIFDSLWMGVLAAGLTGGLMAAPHAVLSIKYNYVIVFTPWGLQMRACGEHPGAADTVGVHVNRMRYAGVILGGLTAGIGGAYFSLGAVGSLEDGMTRGQGFVALAAMIFGNWNPAGGFLAALLFGFADALQVKMQIIGPLLPFIDQPIPPEFLQMAPYVLTIMVVAGVVGRVRPPAAEGKPHEKQ